MSGAEKKAPDSRSPRQPYRSPRRPYRSPRLTFYGDVRDLTLGPSPGIGESGMPLLFRAGVGGSPLPTPLPTPPRR